MMRRNAAAGESQQRRRPVRLNNIHKLMKHKVERTGEDRVCYEHVGRHARKNAHILVSSITSAGIAADRW